MYPSYWLSTPSDAGVDISTDDRYTGTLDVDVEAEQTRVLASSVLGGYSDVQGSHNRVIDCTSSTSVAPISPPGSAQSLSPKSSDQAQQRPGDAIRIINLRKVFPPRWSLQLKCNCATVSSGLCGGLCGLIIGAILNWVLGLPRGALAIVGLLIGVAAGLLGYGLRRRGDWAVAVARINLGIAHRSLFCLLGHNGAGKTTTFNMLSGMFGPTKGDAIIIGKSVRAQLGAVQAMIGICPQHDVLWPELSAYEHLRLFAGLSHMPASDIPRQVADYLEQVDLTEWAHRPTREYSGGMKRRLSVACSLITNPKVSFLDEPTTGMDPVNRRGVWNVLEKAKTERVVLLTTHAMEEADTLGDLISIMSRGRLHCLGTSIRLKSLYGSGYRVDFTFPEEKSEQALGFILYLLTCLLSCLLACLLTYFTYLLVLTH